MKSKRTLKAISYVALVILVISAGVFIYKTGKNKRVIYSHRNEYHEIIDHLFGKKIVENQLVGKIIKKFPPTKISSHDNYLTLQYFISNEDVDDCCIYYSYYLHIIVQDNKLVKAFATEGLFSEIDYVFFNVLNESSEDDYWESRMNNAVTASNT